MIRLITPHQRDRVAGQLRDELRMMQDDVAPEVHGPPVPGHPLVHRAQEIQVNPPAAAFRTGRLAPALAQVHRLVAADVEAPAGEVRQQLVVQLVQQRQPARVERVEAERIRPPLAPGLVAVGTLGQIAVAGMLQPALQVAEGVLVRRQFDSPRPAVRVQRAHLVAGQRAGLRPHLAMARVGEGVLGVELEVIDLQAGQLVHQGVQPRHGGDAGAADVEHDAAAREVGVIDDLPGGQAVARGPADLGQRLQPVAESRLVARGQRDAFARDGQPIALLRPRGLQVLAHRGPGGAPPGGGPHLARPRQQCQFGECLHEVCSGAARSRRKPPDRPVHTASSSATMLSATCSGPSAPRSSPAGP